MEYGDYTQAYCDIMRQLNNDNMNILVSRSDKARCTNNLTYYHEIRSVNEKMSSAVSEI